ncbi:MAG: hypothetical protein IPK07_21145 [Deltaproteobacteria bacterium]|nr:hypothetical protein [Deltaproteobacteria bacterium]
MTVPIPIDALAEVARLVDEYRDRCLWFLDPRFVPTDLDEAIRALDLIERYGDRAAFERAEELRRWLSRPSSPGS